MLKAQNKTIPPNLISLLKNEQRNRKRKLSGERGEEKRGEPLKIVAQLSVQVVGHDLAPLSVLSVLLAVEEPVGDVELTGRSDDGLEGLKTHMTHEA